MAILITAAMLYDLVQCEHRVAKDLFADPKLRDPVSPFVQLLWERGTAYEAQVVAALQPPPLDLSTIPATEREQQTLAAMDAKSPLIYGGRIRVDDLLGQPDILRLEDCGYVPGDIKSGSGEEGPEDDSKPKIHYAVQLGLYVDILRRLNRLSANQGFIWDIHGTEVHYGFDEPYGKREPRTLWQDYEKHLAQARNIVAVGGGTRSALASICKQCHWRTACYDEILSEDDLTQIAELGRSKRDSLNPTIATVKQFASADINKYVKGKKTDFQGIGPDSLVKFQARAQLLSTPGATPYSRVPIELPKNDVELFFDIETDPMQDVCYLHGFVLRKGRDSKGEKFIAFFADDPTPSAEEKTFRDAWRFIQSCRPCALYFYSHYERTYYKKLQAKYPDVCTAEAVTSLFDEASSVDLYTEIAKKHTEWPANDQSIKTLAKLLGFKWRDSDPSGASSIEWYATWLKTGKPEDKQQILDYNEDDCIATRYLADGLRELPVRN